MPDSSAGQNEAAQAASPKRLGVGDGVGRGVLRHCHLDEPRPFQQPNELSRVGEPVHIVPLRHVRWHRDADLRNGIAEDSLDALARRIIPPGKSNPSARQQSPYAFCDRGFWPGKMSEPESADNRVERMIGKRKAFYISFMKIDGGVQSPRQFDHLRRQVDANWARASTCGFGRKSTRPGRNIKQTCFGAQTHGIEERLVASAVTDAKNA
jgi:hypothetical protein